MRPALAPSLLGVALLLPWAARASATEPAPSEDGEAADLRAGGAPQGPILDLQQCLRLARRHYPKVQEARARLGQKRALAWQARTQPFSEVTMTGGVGLAPTVFGTSVYSPNSDAALTSNMGLAWQIGIDATLPLYTFGKLTAAWGAADANVSVGEHEVKKEANAVALDVRRAFYGVQLARDAKLLLDDALATMDKYIRRAQARVDEEEGDEVELLKLQVYREDLAVQLSGARKQERLALAGLRFLTGVTGPFDVPDEPLRRSRHSLAPLARYLSAARLFRPEVNMARAGVVARRAQLELEQSRYYPDFGLALSTRWARAPEVADQVNPFVKDPGNFTSYGFALVLRWKLDFLPQAARVAQAAAQLEEQRATERFALGGVGVEVEQAWEEARDAELRLSATTRAVGFAKRWLIKIQQAVDVGTAEDEELVAPAKEYALKRFALLSATYDYNVAVAKLSLATGWDAVGGAEETPTAQ